MKQHLILSRIPAGIAAAGLLAAFAALPSSASAAASEDQAMVNASPDYDMVREKLISAEALELNFDKANLRDVMRMLATKSGIHFLSMPLQKDLDKQLVTISMKMSPFAALETLANENGIALVYDRGVWHLRPFNDTEMIARTYIIKYNTGEVAVTTGTSSSGGTAGGLGGGESSGGDTGGGGSGGGTGSGLDLGAAGNIFKVNDKEMVDKVKEILGVDTSGFNAAYAPDVSVDEFSNSPILVPSQAPRASSGEAAKEGKTAKVVWNSDSNTLFVVATRQQHQFVERWVSSIDRKQSLIAVELKFVETVKDPKNQLGVDWSGTFGNGFKLRLGTPSTVINLNDSIKEIGAALIPSSAILTPDDVNVKLNFLLRDRETSTVSYPRVLTQNNREVSMRSVVNFPVLATRTITPGGINSGIVTTTVRFLPIGTTVNILPKRINDNKVIMHTKIVVANVIGRETIDDNPYPIATSRVYQAPLEVQSGYTVAIAGLDEANDAREGNGLPILSRVPVLGWAFKTRNRDRTRKNLMIFITPTIMPVDGNGVSERPISELPRYHGDEPAAAPRIFPNGELEGGVPALENAVKWCDQEERRIRNVCQEARASSPDFKWARNEFGHILQLGKVNYALRGYIATLQRSGETDPSALQLPLWNLNQICRRSRSLWLEHFRQSLHTPGISDNSSLYFE